MKGRESVSLATRWLSNRRYLNEVPVKGKTTHRFYKTLGYFDSYHHQIIRIGNCLTLLSDPFAITANTYWKLHYLEDYVRFRLLYVQSQFSNNTDRSLSTIAGF